MWLKNKNEEPSTNFLCDEDGSLIVFILVIFAAVFLVGGTAIDLARHEQVRTSLQYNLDRAVLVAASKQQTRDPDEIVRDYMAKAQIPESFQLQIKSDVAGNGRTVSATATTNFDTWFLSMAGIHEMLISVSSTASEKIPGLEISIVLDVSSSMQGSRLAAAKVAAKDFVTTILGSADANTTAISIVPFNRNVTPSVEIYNALNINETQTYSTCLDFKDSDFSKIAIEPSTPQTQAVYTSRKGDEFQQLESDERTCFTDEYIQIMGYSQDEAALHEKIDGLEAGYGTSGHMGLKWGLALLDPSFKSVVTSLQSAGMVDPGFTNLPTAYSDSQARKVVVFMGDGANSREYRFGNKFRGPNSDLFEVNYTAETFDYAYRKNNVSKTSNSESKCSNSKWECVYSIKSSTDHYLRNPSNNEYLNIESGDWISSSDFNDLPTELEGWTNTVRLDWEDAWGQMSAEWYSDTINDDTAYDDLKYDSSRSYDQSDDAMSLSRAAAKTAGIIVYTIGFETSSSTSQKLRDCASTDSHYYDAAGSQIVSVFGAIAVSIQKLKLTE